MSDPKEDAAETAPPTPNDAYRRVDVWGNEVARRWLAFEAPLDRALAPFGDAALARARVLPGERVLDVGCGTGTTTISVAGAVGAGGHVLGVDIAPLLLQRAREQALGRPEIEFLEADAQTVSLARDWDLIFSRFGMMFFADATAAFRNLGRALRPGGRFTFVCWRAFAENPWQSLAFMAMRKALPAVPLPGGDGPGPHTFADPQTVRRVLGAAGLVEIDIEAVDHPVRLGADLPSALQFALNTGPTARALAETNDEIRSRARDHIATALARLLTADGVTLGASAWIVTAFSPDRPMP